MMNTQCISHNYKSYLWLPDDEVEVAEIETLKQNHSRSQAGGFAVCVRFLEVLKDSRLAALDKAGFDEKDVTEEMLWLDIEWPRMSRFGMRIYGPSSLKKNFPRVITAGFAQQRYIKRNPKTGERICDENGVPLVYSTYQDAKTDSYLDAEGDERKAINRLEAAISFEPLTTAAENTAIFCTSAGIGPTISIPGTGRSSLSAWIASSASPLATAVTPSVVLFRFISSAIPSRGKSFVVR